MTRQPLVARRAEELLGHAVVATAPVAGGDIATATKLRMSDGTVALMKTLTHPPSGFFPSEARGLDWLGEAGPDGVPIAEVLAVAEDCLIVRWIEQGRASTEAAAVLGRTLAAMHAAAPASYGLESDGFIGTLPLPNRPAPSWAEFYAVRRVLPYLKLAADRGHATPAEVAAVERVIGRLPELVPEQGPARIHGDLWNGNVLWGAEGHCHLIDPAAHGGHRETDLAMLALFGLPHLGRVIDAYQEVTPLVPGWEERQGLHQLHPLLVHACLFGGGYAARAAGVAVHFTGSPGK